MSESFNERYLGVPPWEIGRPQAVFTTLADGGHIKGSVLDIGCGTGENALMLAARGHEVVGVDAAARAIARAKEKAEARSLRVTFLEHDALALGALSRTFDTAIDSGVFHIFDNDGRTRYETGVAAVLRPGGRLFLVCMSEHEPNWGGPRRVTQDEIRATFGERARWAVESIAESTYELHTKPEGARAWLATLRRGTSDA